MKEPRWTTISESAFAWEKEALDWLRERLPDRDPWHVWSNFEFIDDQGKVNEVDALVLSPVGLFLVEIKSRPGTVTGDAHTWTWRGDGRDYAHDNPLILANRKAKRLAALLRRQSSVIKARSRVPFIEPLIFLSAISPEQCKLSGNARSGVVLRGRPDAPDDDGIVARLSGTGHYPPRDPLLGREIGRVVCRAVVEAGVRPSNQHRRVGDYQLGALLLESENFQDWEGAHVVAAGVQRRIRIYGYALAATQEARRALVRQATREFQILEGVEHPGILRVRDYQESELGPALLFDYDPHSRGLDFVLREHGARLNVDQRLSILRQLAETLKYAHQKKLYHRALAPSSILVQNPDRETLKLAIMNWQLAARGEQTQGETLGRTAGTQHVEDYVDDQAKIFLAPEALWDGATAGPHLDVFSLGVIAWQVFAAQPPAATAVELQQKLKAGNGLRISDVLDGAGRELQNLIQFSTCPDVSARLASMDDFLEYLELVEDELTAPATVASVDPAHAKAGDRIDGGFTVVRRLGKGSSSDVLLVKRDGSDEELVLKVALDRSHNDRLVAEGEALAKLRHANIVAWRETLAVAGRTALLMKSAGPQTLAHHLRQEARPSLDLIRRFGEELLQTVAYLEDQGIHHRDIKPDNIGLCPSAHSGKLQLILFDFSLSRTPVDNIQAGTRPYLDPFLSLGKPPRWDLYAERFAAAMTLYEMVTGALPVWGDGLSDPALIEDEVTLDVGRFDPNLREGLSHFFSKALHRDFRARYDNSEDLLRAWRATFDRVAATTATDPFETMARCATRDTTIGELGYSVEAQNVLDRMGIHQVRDLLAVDRVRFRYLKSVGDKVRKEIRLTAKRLAQLRPDLAAGTPTVLDAAPGRTGIRSIDELVDHLLPGRSAAEDRPEEEALAFYLGIAELGPAASAPDPWPTLFPTLGDAAQAAGIARPALTHALAAARARWLKSPAITDLREELAATLGASGGVVSAAEAAASLLASHGSIEQDNAVRLRLAAAVLRAVVEAEADLAQLRFQLFPGPQPGVAPLVAASVDHADYALRLGTAADQAVSTDDGTGGLPTPQQAIERLEAVDRPHTVSPMSAQRLLRLAAGSSQRAAVSSRLELYPRGMAAQRAIQLALGSLVGPRLLTEAQVRERILGRYPEAENLPTRSNLDRLLVAAGADLVWRGDGELGPGYYPSRKSFGPSAGSSTYTHRNSAALADENISEEVAAARQFEDKLRHAAKAGGFLVLTVAPRPAHRAASAITARFAEPLGFRTISLDRLILECLQEEAAQLRVAWSKVLEADLAGPGSRDWNHLIRLASRAKARVKARLLAEQSSLLLLHPGLLARLDLMDLVSDLQSLAGAATGIPSVWLLAPMAGQGLPTLDGVPIPVISQAQWARVPEAWMGLHSAAP